MIIHKKQKGIRNNFLPKEYWQERGEKISLIVWGIVVILAFIIMAWWGSISTTILTGI